MICPWLKKKTQGKTDWGEVIVKESFMPCEGEECPWYQPMYNDGSLIIEERCRRAITEYVGAKNGNDKG